MEGGFRKGSEDLQEFISNWEVKSRTQWKDLGVKVGNLGSKCRFVWERVWGQ